MQKKWFVQNFLSSNFLNVLQISEMSKRERSPSWSPPSSSLPWMRVDHQPSSLLASMGTFRSPLLQNSAVLTTPDLPSILTAGERTRQDLANTVRSAIFWSETLKINKNMPQGPATQEQARESSPHPKIFPKLYPSIPQLCVRGSPKWSWRHSVR